MSNSLENILNQLGLVEHNGVFFRDEKNGQVFNGFSSELKKKLDIIKPDAYFVFNQQPFILFFDLTQDTSTEKESINKFGLLITPRLFLLLNNQK